MKFVHENGLEDGVMTLEEIRSDVESREAELAGIDRIVLIWALKLLEQRGKAVIFKGTSTDDEENLEESEGFGKISKKDFSTRRIWCTSLTPGPSLQPKINKDICYQRNRIRILIYDLS